jgi:hypothetical protein
MKFALVNNIKSEAVKGVIGLCPSCNSELIAKCGNKMLHHWSHKRVSNCDPWWENEGEWHRNWKNHYPIDWQERLFIDAITNEKHIADVITSNQLVIEFQNSPISQEERNSREKFYKNMVWVVNGSNRKRDYKRFLKASKDFLPGESRSVYFVRDTEDFFPMEWLNSTVPVVLDFNENNKLSIPQNDNLYCLMPFNTRRDYIITVIPRDVFINYTINGQWSSRVKSFSERIELQNTIQNLYVSNLNSASNVQSKDPKHIVDMKRGKFIERKRW